MRNSNTKISKGFFAILIVLMPLLSVYAFPGIPSLTLGEPVLLLYCFFWLPHFVKSNRNKLIVHSPLYWLFIIYVIIVSFVNALCIYEYSITDAITASLRVLLYTVVIFVISKGSLETEFFRKTYLLVCFLSATYLIIQLISGTMLNIYLPSTFTNMKIMYSNYTGYTYNQFLFDNYTRLGFRPSSWFKEPSHLSRYIIYSLPIISLKQERKSRFEVLTFIIVIIAILSTRSAMGFLGLGLFMITWLYFNRKSKSLYIKIGAVLVAILILIASAYFGLAEQAVGRLSVESGSGGSRIYRGFSIYSKMPLVFKIFGSGLGNYSAFAYHYDITTIYDRAGDSGNNYMNLIATTLVSSGLLGFIIYMSSLVKLVWHKSNVQITCFILFLFFAFGTNIIYHSAEYILPLLFVALNLNAQNNDNS